MEGAKGNASFLINLARQNSIICLQETWLWTFEDYVIENLVPNYETFVRCSDINDNISNFQIMRGNGGIVILWPKTWTNCIRKLEDGNERIQAVELNTTDSCFCIVNVYLPTLKLPTSKDSYSECLDILHSIIVKYSGTHKIIVCGDFNGTLLPIRSNPHDVMLKDLVEELQLYRYPENCGKPTFFGHSGATSQIDYVLSSCQSAVLEATTDSISPINMSSHVPIYAHLNVGESDLNVIKKQTSAKSTRTFNWEKTDKQQYQDKILNILLEKESSKETCNLSLLVEVLKSASHKVVPNRLVKVKGPRFKLSPAVKRLESNSKQLFFLWKRAGSPGPEHPISIQRKVAKYDVRKQIRREFACARDSFYSELMENPSNKLFYKLIRRNQSSGRTLPSGLVVNGSEITDNYSQCRAFAGYFEDLAAPKDHPDFNQDYLETAMFQETIIEKIHEQFPDELIPIAEQEVLTAIKSLNSGKAADEMEITAEHLKYSGNVLLPYIASVFNDILVSKNVPDSFKSGLIYPIHKKAKDPRCMENYRGITVSSVLGKLFETVILNRLQNLNEDQSELQYGFTKGLSPTMASLLLSEAVLDSTLSNRPLYIATIEKQKAFDVVSHPVLMVKLYQQGINSHLWQVIRSMYKGLTAKVKWEGEVSPSINVLQGVRQGGILSTHFYKAYCNDQLTELEETGLGKYIGPIYIGCPTVADDLLFISEDDVELQLMFNLSYIKSQEKRYHIHPQKTVIVRKNVTKDRLKEETVSEWTLGSTSVKVDSKTTHLGLSRTEKSEVNINIADRVSLARRTLYALIKTGVHGSNGLNPKVSYRIYQAYVLPRLLYSLETLNLRQVHINQLQRFHVATLRNIQSLPVRTASSVVHLLLGALPLHAEIHKRQLSLLYSIIHAKNTKMKDLMYRQLAIGASGSFFVTAEQVLDQYNLPAIPVISEFSKLRWRNLCRRSVNTYWSVKLRDEAHEKSTLSHCNIALMSVGKTHMVWDSVSNNASDVKRCITKVRMLTGVYILQSTKARFNQYSIEQTCPLCRLATEDLQHMLLRCPALHEARLSVLGEIRDLLTGRFGQSWWRSRSRDQLVALLLDSTTILEQTSEKRESNLLFRLEALGRRFCNKLHMKRLQLHQTFLSKT
ncbi:MAG: reverse transcriptase family protein [Candidatus Thiodiazotropha endolucinida]|nr:reverse transcriptase family protein [Candidatus Thiodiazotropha endolucinida]